MPSYKVILQQKQGGKGNRWPAETDPFSFVLELPNEIRLNEEIIISIPLDCEAPWARGGYWKVIRVVHEKVHGTQFRSYNPQRILYLVLSDALPYGRDEA
ncbi:MAG: hypothetical protein HY482_02785 [Candidatus Wildermuthbacteria bacterium]|nr:hypothetical protein [Candidatus Wildermuthbacteria bacterium]